MEAGKIKRSRNTKFVKSVSGSDIYQITGGQKIAGFWVAGPYVVIWPENGHGEENRDWTGAFDTIEEATEAAEKGPRSW